MNAKPVGGQVVTMKPERPAVTAVAIRDGRIAAVGDDHEVRAAEVPRAAHDERGYGMLRAGLAADLVVLGADPREETAHIDQIPVLTTVSRGMVTFDSGDLR